MSIAESGNRRLIVFMSTPHYCYLFFRPFSPFFPLCVPLSLFWSIAVRVWVNERTHSSTKAFACHVGFAVADFLLPPSPPLSPSRSLPIPLLGYALPVMIGEKKSNYTNDTKFFFVNWPPPYLHTLVTVLRSLLLISYPALCLAGTTLSCRPCPDTAPKLSDGPLPKNPLHSVPSRLHSSVPPPFYSLPISPLLSSVPSSLGAMRTATPMTRSLKSAALEVVRFKIVPCVLGCLLVLTLIFHVCVAC